MDEYTHPSEAYRAHYAVLKSSQGNRERQQCAWQWIGMMRKWLWHSIQSPQSLSFYWWFSVAGWIVSVTSTHMSSNVRLLWPGYAVTHYIATITVVKLRMQATAVSKSFHLPTCLFHQQTHQTKRAWPEMSCDQCISLKGPWRCNNRETEQQLQRRESVNLQSFILLTLHCSNFLIIIIIIIILKS